ncbi:hypothetical protein BK128_21415 [Viridibacillus sp. FSL H7-0596]|uniref:hypothetical protein n=1 Tax=Viridibacillus sp. FSL H7-0596 TaxID=1928923 RepID=UPI00096D8007|nr:hypothetical protein [Viridibacillus sp. FSL H7-0596]OMC81832.1 hypothetical protein BK128_21415 [Viridibacillus sp. FSL H7-0596]
MAELRKLISWRIEQLNEQDRQRINDWLDQQNNIQNSLTNIALHMINRFGETDVMSYDVQRALFKDLEVTEPNESAMPSDATKENTEHVQILDSLTSTTIKNNKKSEEKPDIIDNMEIGDF